MSHDLLDDLLTDVPRHVVPDADRAWRVGTVRRRRRYAGEGLAVAAAVALVGLGLVKLHDHTPVQPAGPVGKIAGHPAVVSRPFFEQPMPDPPGPIAGAIETGDNSWYAVDEHGRSWRLPATNDGFFALSDDGSQLGFLRSDGSGRGHYETVDLNTGVVTTYRDLGEGSTRNDAPVTGQPYWAASQYPAYWSPDAARLVVAGGTMVGNETTALLLEDGEITALTTPGYPVGWASPTTVVWLAYNGSKVRITDLSGTVVREVPLQVPQPLRTVTQWSGRVSPDGARLGLVDSAPQANNHRTWVFSLADGVPETGKPWHAGSGQTILCPLAWHGDQVAAWFGNSLRDIPNQSPDGVIAPSDHWGVVECGTWAADALAGPAQPAPGLTEWRYWRLWWHWVDVLLFGCVAAALAGAWLWRRRRRLVTAETTVDWWA